MYRYYCFLCLNVFPFRMGSTVYYYRSIRRRYDRQITTNQICVIRDFRINMYLHVFLIWKSQRLLRFGYSNPYTEVEAKQRASFLPAFLSFFHGPTTSTSHSYYSIWNHQNQIQNLIPLYVLSNIYKLQPHVPNLKQ